MDCKCYDKDKCNCEKILLDKKDFLNNDNLVCNVAGFINKNPNNEYSNIINRKNNKFVLLDTNNLYKKDKETFTNVWNSNNIFSYHVVYNNHITTFFINKINKYIIYYDPLLSFSYLYDSLDNNTVIINFIKLICSSIDKENINNFDLILTLSCDQKYNPFCNIYKEVFLNKINNINEDIQKEKIINIIYEITKEDVCNYLYDIYKIIYQNINDNLCKQIFTNHNKFPSCNQNILSSLVSVCAKKFISYKNNIYKIKVVDNKCSINNIPINDFNIYDIITNFTCEFPEDGEIIDSLKDDNDELQQSNIDSNYIIKDNHFKKYLKYKRKYLQLKYNR